MKFKTNDFVQYKHDKSIKGLIVGYYSTSKTPEGYCIETENSAVIGVSVDEISLVAESDFDFTSTSLCEVLTSPDLQPEGKPRNWFRPIEWRGSGSAYTLTNYFLKMLEETPSKQHGIMTNVDNLTGEWEIVTPADVMQERETA